MRLFPLILFTVLAVVFGFMLLHKLVPVPTGASSNAPLPAITVTSLDGKTAWDAGKLKGHVNLINFFASWCTPCAAEMPELVALKKQFPKLQMHGIVWNDEPETVRKWLKQHGNPFGMLWLDKKGDTTIALGIRGIPESIIVDAEGNIRYRIAGVLGPEQRTGEVGALIGTLLQEAAHAH